MLLKLSVGDLKIVMDNVCGGRLTEKGIRPLSGAEMRKAYKNIPEATQFIDMPANHTLKDHFARLDADKARCRTS